MKKIKSLLLSAAALLAAAVPAQAATLIVDDASHVTATYYDPVTYNQMELEFVNNQATIQTQISYNIMTVDPYIIKSVTASDYNTPYYSTTYCSLYANTDDVVYTMTTVNLEEARTASCTVNVDDASLVSAYISATSRNITFDNGSNTLRFDPELENTLSLSSTNYYQPLYEVKLNGEPVESYGSYYEVILTNGCTVDVTAKVPALPATVSFEYNEAGFGIIEDVKVNNQPVENFDGYTLSVTTGDLVELTASTLYGLDGFYINGETQYWYGTYPYSFTVMADTQIRIEAHKYATYKVTLSIDNPENIRIYNSSYASGDEITITGNLTELELPENNAVLSWKAAAKCYIESVTVDGQPYQSDYIYLTDGMNISFVTGEYAADKTLVIWMDNRDIPMEYFSFASQQTHDEFTILTGYNILEYYEAMAPFGFSWYSSQANITDPRLYLDGQQLSPLYEGSTTYEITPTSDNSVFKIFLTTTPVECAVTISNTDEIPVAIKHDLVMPLEASELTCFAGTQIEITTDYAEPVEVKVNNAAVTAGEDGAFKFIVEDPQTDVVISKKSTVAITSVTTDTEAASAPVYNLQGIRVATAGNLSGLPAGIYIVNGRKVAVK